MKFIRKNGRIIPIREGAVAGAAGVGAYGTVRVAAKFAAKAKDYAAVADRSRGFQFVANNHILNLKSIKAAKSAKVLRTVAGGLALVSIGAAAVGAYRARKQK